MSEASIAWTQISVMTKMACGAREAVVCDDGKKLRFKVGKAMTWIEVTYDPSDTYTVEKVRVKRGSHERIVEESHSDVYAENLNEIIYRTVNK